MLDIIVKGFHMIHQVFISYSRRDTKTVDKICKTFDDNGITYFIDRTGISGGLEFPEIIVKAIEECEVFLFIGSQHSYSSRYVSNEVTYAYNVKGHNSIIPYLIDNTPLPGSLQFIFGNVNYRKIKEHPIDTVLLQDIKALLKSKTGVTPSASPAETKQTHKSLRGIFTDKQPMLYSGMILQIAMLLTVLIFFCQLLKPDWGYIGKHPGSVYWWTCIILCASLILSIIGTALLPLKSKNIFYGLCGLDVIQSICICAICTRVGRINYEYKTETYKLLDTIGDIINYHTILSVALIVLLITLHCFVMSRAINIKLR